jgi:hypothetical protein
LALKDGPQSKLILSLRPREPDALASIQLKPGVNTLATPTLNQAGISVSNLIRFRGGLPEKVGGWQKLIIDLRWGRSRAVFMRGRTSTRPSGLRSAICRLCWPCSAGHHQHHAADQDLKLCLNLTTVKGSTTVTIIDTNISTLTQYDSVFFNTPISVGGLLLVGSYQSADPGRDQLYHHASDASYIDRANAGAVPAFTTAIGLIPSL